MPSAAAAVVGQQGQHEEELITINMEPCVHAFMHEGNDACSRQKCMCPLIGLTKSGLFMY
jgi:hypothetical protein